MGREFLAMVFDERVEVSKMIGDGLSSVYPFDYRSIPQRRSVARRVRDFNDFPRPLWAEGFVDELAYLRIGYWMCHSSLIA